MDDNRKLGKIVADYLAEHPVKPITKEVLHTITQDDRYLTFASIIMDEFNDFMAFAAQQPDHPRADPRGLMGRICHRLYQFDQAGDR